MMRITLKQLAVFTTVYRVGTATRAGDELALSQSAVSSALNELEKSLNTNLFERNGKRLIATITANKLYPKAAALLAQAAEIETEFKQADIQLHIGASTTIGNYLLPALISAFSRENPAVEIILHVHNTKEICDNILNFNYDLGFIEGENEFDEITAEKWRQDELTLFAAVNSRFIPPQTDSVSLMQLQKLPLVLREQGSGTRTTIERLILSRLAESKVLELHHSEAIRQAVIHDFGIGCLSKHVLEDALKLGKIRRLQLEGGPLFRTLWLIRHRNKHISDPLAQFMEFCRKMR